MYTVQSQRKRSQQPRRQKVNSAPPKGNRLSVAFLVVSSLVICSLLAAGLVTAVSLDIFGSDDDDPGTNIEDPNADLVSAQETKVAENPDDYEALVLLANVLGNSNRLDEAIPIYEKALQQRPDDAATRLDFARALYDGGKMADAEVQFRKVIELDPDNQAAVYYLAELYRTSSPIRTDEAIPLYQRAVAIDDQSFIGEQSANHLNALGAPGPLSSPSSSPQAEATP
jgi:cytochrome c-type biogenesis protein CcmH/NrfG